MIKAGIAGGTGYVAGELIRLLLAHPETEVSCVFSHSSGGQAISSVHQDLFAHDLIFSGVLDPDLDILFLCLGHGMAAKFLAEHLVSVNTRVVDLSHDFRLSNHSVFQDRAFVYGLPELNKVRIIPAASVANPGCFATAIQLALLPVAQAALLDDAVHVTAVTGSTGAGQSFSETTHFSWRNQNLSIYKLFSHQHLGEITESVMQLDPTFAHPIHFVPMRGGFTRGILASVYTKTTLTQEHALFLFREYYADAPFTTVTDQPIHLKQIVNTNHCLISVHVSDGLLHVTAVIDNLLKGASGQAVQNMNLMFGLDETLGLELKANYF